MTCDLATKPGTGVDRVNGDPTSESNDQTQALNKLEKDSVVVDKFTDKSGITYKVNRAGVPIWADRPQKQNPLSDPRFYQLSAVKTEVFNLGDSERLKAYNELYAKAWPTDAPRVTIHSDIREFYRGNFVCLVTYSEVWYSCFIQN